MSSEDALLEVRPQRMMGLLAVALAMIIVLQALVLAQVMSLAPVVPAAAAEVSVAEDVNRDGQVNALDVQLVVNAVLQEGPAAVAVAVTAMGVPATPAPSGRIADASPAPSGVGTLTPVVAATPMATPVRYSTARPTQGPTDQPVTEQPTSVPVPPTAIQPTAVTYHVIGTSCTDWANGLGSPPPRGPDDGYPWSEEQQGQGGTEYRWCWDVWGY